MHRILIANPYIIADLDFFTFLYFPGLSFGIKF